jgi:hypothetical protein
MLQIEAEVKNTATISINATIAISIMIDCKTLANEV